MAMALTAKALHESPVSGSRSTETNRAEPVDGHEMRSGRNPCISDQTKNMAPLVITAASMAFPHLVLSKLICLPSLLGSSLHWLVFRQALWMSFPLLEKEA